MRFGVLGLDVNQVDTIAEAGYDCAEFDVSKIMELSNSEFEVIKKSFSGSSLDFDVFDNPLPLNVSICELGFNTIIWREYLKKACFRTSELGGKLFVFGNGETRSIPTEGDLTGAREKVAKFVITLCEIAADYGITVMLKPLAEQLSNMYNTLDDCVAAINTFGLRNLATMCDLKQIVALNLPMSDIVKHKDLIRHVQIGYPHSAFSRSFYPKADDSFNYKPFFDTLKEIKYNDIICVEANTYEDFAGEIARGLDFIKALAAEDK